MTKFEPNSNASPIAQFLANATALETALAGNPLSFDDIALLDQLKLQEGSCSNELGEACGISAASCTRHMSQLVSLDLVAESLSRDDLRKNSYRLSVKGSAVLYELDRTTGFSTAAFAAVYRSLRRSARKSGLDFTEQRVLLSLLHAGPQPVRGICAATGLAQPKASMALGRLLDAGLAAVQPLSKNDASADKRLRLWCLCGNGRQAATLLAGEIA